VQVRLGTFVDELLADDGASCAAMKRVAGFLKAQGEFTGAAAFQTQTLGIVPPRWAFPFPPSPRRAFPRAT
jgi:hypothetical protein